MTKVTPTSRDSSQHPESIKTLRQAALVEHAKRIESASKVHSKAGAKEGLTPPVHHTSSNTTGRTKIKSDSVIQCHISRRKG